MCLSAPVLVHRPPDYEPHQQLKDTQPRSPLELKASVSCRWLISKLPAPDRDVLDPTAFIYRIEILFPEEKAILSM